MTYALSQPKPAFRRAKHFGEELLAAGDRIVAAGVVPVLEPYWPIFPTAYGWWRFINHSARLLWQATNAGFSAEVTALTRNITDHTYSLAWLADVGEPGLAALEGAQYYAQSKIYEEAKEADWPLPDDAELRAAPQEPADPVEARRHRAIMGEISHFGNLAKAFSPDEGPGNSLYVVYRHLSDYTHAGPATAGRYAEPAGDGLFRLTDRAVPPGPADAIWTTVCLIQAGHIFSPMLTGDPLRDLLEKAANDMGLGTPERIAPRRKVKDGKQKA
ncbi:hypothetical protein ETD86_29425 [Nonomuraea turkmeniaca]|uniref:Uncharacterized protein n=1 Tax=Nonomuraea turkmeniaca TaxID=103838 RepID=A0A5S4FAG5_9ACTN|nr:hypothetical protein [Nonomuraea turkmeniaca]TMR14069.1 hypothetical protein ETD86_29425 [Nonomuraea turkmeniaca]